MCSVLLVELETATGQGSALRGQLPFHRVWQNQGHSRKLWGRDGGSLKSAIISILDSQSGDIKSSLFLCSAFFPPGRCRELEDGRREGLQSSIEL